MIKKLNILHQTMVYAASVHTDLDSIAEVSIFSLSLGSSPYILFNVFLSPVDDLSVI